MSTTIDERVLEMTFDNRQFENGVSTTLSTLDKLKTSLNLTGATKGLENIEATAKGITMSGLSSAIETVQYKFSALEVMAMSALSNITNSAVNAGKRLVSAFTVDPVKSGFQEYETQINAVQTILANTESKGSTLEDVNEALDELNTYADKTIYNFTEMTRNIGTFTAAGVELDKSVQSIKGIANLAAVSGSTSQQASTAMYQLSQALASGRVALQDWNSVVNAGMGGQVFQDALKRTATVMGTNVDAMIKKYGSFRESLTQGGWLTAEVLNETLGQFAGAYTDAELLAKGYSEQQVKDIQSMAKTATDAATKVKTFTQLMDTLKEAAQSGWTQSWEIIIGDFGEAKEMLTQVSDVFGEMINASSEARNSMLQDWKDLGGRTALIESCQNAFQGLVSVLTPIHEAFQEIFPPTTGEQLFALTNGLKSLTEHFKLSDTQSANLKSTFKGLFAVLDIGKQAFTAIGKAVVPIIGKITGVGDGVLSVTGTFGDWLVKLDEFIKKSDVFNKVLGNLSNLIQNGLDKASSIINQVVESFSVLVEKLKTKISIPSLELIHSFLERFHVRMNQVSETAGGLRDAVGNTFTEIGKSVTSNLLVNGVSTIINAFVKLWDVLKTVGEGIFDVCETIGSGIGNAFNGINFDQIFDLVNGGLLAGLLTGLNNFVGGFKKSFKDVGGAIENITETLDSVRGCFEAYQRNLNAKTLLTIASAIGILAVSLTVLSTIDSVRLTAATVTMTAMFGDLVGAMALLNKIGSVKGVTKTVASMVAIASAVLILASALKKISDLNLTELAKGLTGVAGLTAIIVTATKSLSSGDGKIMKGATSLVVFATAIKVLASACEDLSQLNLKELAKGLTGVGVLMAEVSLFLNNTKFSGKATSSATGMVILAGAIKILASACDDLGSMSWTEIGKGLAGIGGLLTEIALFTNLTGNAKHVVSTGTAMVLLGSSMKIFASAMKDFSSMSWEEIARGMTAMAGALTAVTVAVNLMPKNMVSTGAGLVVVSSALVILSDALVKMSGMSWDEVGRGMTALGGAMLILAVGLNAMNGTLAGSAALIVAAGALAVMAPTLSLLGAMSWKSIVKGLISLAGAFTIIGVAGALLTPLVPTILALAGSFALIGAAVLGIGAGLMAAGAGLSAIAVGIVALVGAVAGGATSIVAAFGIILTGLIGLIPNILRTLGDVIVAICDVIIECIPKICEAIVEVVKGVVKALVECVPDIVAGVLKILLGVLEAIVDYGPTIIGKVVEIIVMLLVELGKAIPDFVDAAVDLMIAFISGVYKKLPDIIDAGMKTIIAFMNGMADALNENTPAMIDAVQNLMLALLKAAIQIMTSGPSMFRKVAEEIMESGFVQGIKSKFNSAKTAVSELVTNVKNAIKEKYEEFKDAGKYLIAGFVQGFSQSIGTAIAPAKALASSVTKTVTDAFDIHSPSRVFRNQIGKQLGAGLALGIDDSSEKAETAAEKMAKKATEKAKNAFNNFKEWISDKKYYDELTLEEELYAWEEASKYYSKYSDIKKEADKEVYRVKKELEEEAFNSSKEWIEDRKYYNQLTLKQELEAWERIQTKYKEGTDKRKEADKEVYRLKQELEEEAFNNSKEWIDDQKFYDKMTLKQELSAWKRIQAKYKEGTDQRKEADKEVYTLEKELNSKTEEYEANRLSVNKQYNDERIKMEEEYSDKVTEIYKNLSDDIASLENDYKSAVESRANSIYGAYSLFDAVDLGESIDSDTLMDNLQGQVDALFDWRKTLDQLSDRGVGDAFIDELTEMGPSALKQLKALNSMSDSELNQYVDLWDEKHQMANDKASEELESLRVETVDKIAQLREDANAELDEYRAVWDSQMETLKNDTIAQLNELEEEWTKSVGDLPTMNLSNELLLASGEDTGESITDSVSTGMINNIVTVESSAQEVSDAALTTISQNENEYVSVGSNIVDGLVKGINDNTYKILDVVEELAYNIVETIRRVLDIHSPSRVMQSLGEFTTLGFINGLNSYSGQLDDASSNIGETATNSLRNAISKITSVIESDVDTQPTIRPVLDLTDVESNAGRLNALFSREQALSINTGMNSRNKIQNGDSNSANGNSTTYQFTQNNYSPKALSRAEIYRQTKNQFSTMKGVLS